MICRVRKLSTGIFLILWFTAGGEAFSSLPTPEEKGKPPEGETSEDSCETSYPDPTMYLQGFAHVSYREEEGKPGSMDVRRARVTLKGKTTAWMEYVLQTELAGDDPRLLDAKIMFRNAKGMILSAGQQIIPFGLESRTSTSRLDTVNRSRVVEALAARGKDVIKNQNGRDVGVLVTWLMKSKANSYRLKITGGVFNGSGINTGDLDQHKDLCARIHFYVESGFSMGVSVYDGFMGSGDQNTAQERKRAGVDLELHLADWGWKGEWIRGMDGSIEREGGYFQLLRAFGNSWEGVIRFESYDPDKDVGHDAREIYLLGVNWHLKKCLRSQLNFESRLAGGKHNFAVYLQIQFNWKSKIL